MPALRQLIYGAALLAVTFGANGAVQGELGVNSTAELDITVTIQPTIQINSVSDIQLDIFDVTSDAAITQTLCVRGTPGSKYSIIASGSQGSDGSFVLTNNEGLELPYQLTFMADLTSGTSDELTPSTVSPLYDVLSSSQNCDGSNTSSFTLTFDTATLQQVQTGTYTGYLTLYVAPQ